MVNDVRPDSAVECSCYEGATAFASFDGRVSVKYLTCIIHAYGREPFGLKEGT